MTSEDATKQPSSSAESTSVESPEKSALAERAAQIEALWTRLQEISVAANSELEKTSAARAAAESARTAAEAERDQSAQAKAATDAARVAAEAEREQATLAKAPAIEAKSATESARDQAVSSATAAKTAEEAAVASRAQAATATTETQAAKQVATDACDEAVEANNDAKQAKADTEKHRDDALAAKASTESAKKDAEAALSKAIQAATNAETEAIRASNAHNLSTTAGLAGAFNQKAISGRNREIAWAIALISALIVAGLVGYWRYIDISAFLRTNPASHAVMAEVLLAVLGLGAPVWLAWIATTMISKNFALREDYSYKASLAQAYIGFKQEAKGMDPLLEQRLFAAAITQLDANPVRFINPNHPGSPLQDLLQQPFMQEVLKNSDIKQQLVEWLKIRTKSAAPHLVKTDVPASPQSATPISPTTTA